MKYNIRHILLSLALGALFVQCSDDEAAGWKDTSGDNYKSFWYYSYEQENLLTHDTVGLAAGKFIPYTVAHRGDTLFVGNNVDKEWSLILFDQKTNRPFRTLTSWTANGKEQKFNSPIEAIVVTPTRLYVAERQSYIHAFDLPDLNYIVSIGNGQWAGPVFQAQAVAVKEGLIYARDKNGQVSVYKESDAVPEKAGKINRYKQVGGGGPNNGFAPHYMEFDADGRLMLTDYESKTIRVLDVAQINDEMKNGTVIDLADQAWTLPFKAKTFASCTERIYATGDNNAINIYDRETKKWSENTVKTIKGFAFGQPAKIHAQADDTFWISDLQKQALVKMTLYKGEIREFSRINDRIVRVEAAVTTKGAESSEPFYVDILTHEIVAPETIGE